MKSQELAETNVGESIFIPISPARVLGPTIGLFLPVEWGLLVARSGGVCGSCYGFVSEGRVAEEESGQLSRAVVLFFLFLFLVLAGLDEFSLFFEAVLDGADFVDAWMVCHFVSSGGYSRQ